MVDERFFKLKVERGDAIAAGARRVTPVALVAGLGAAKRNRFALGYAWARPLWLEVSDERGTRQVIVPDVSLFILLALALLSAVLYAVTSQQRRPG